MRTTYSGPSLIGLTIHRDGLPTFDIEAFEQLLTQEKQMGTPIRWKVKDQHDYSNN